MRRALRLSWVLAICACGRIGFTDVQDAAPHADGDAGAISCALQPTPATGHEYFVGPSGSDLVDGTTAATAWATFDRAWSTIQPGDTLTILDGVYRQVLRPTVSGTPGAPILIRADHDGRAVIDGEDLRETCTLAGASAVQRISDVELEGIYCENPVDTTAGGETAVLVDHADRIQLRRVTARDIHDGVFGIYDVDGVVLEDVAAYGGGNSMFAFAYTTAAVLRRCYARWTAGPGPYAGVVDLDTSDVLVENCMVTAATTGVSVSAYATITSVSPANDNRLLANIARGHFDEGMIPTWEDPGGNLRATGTIVRDFTSIVSGFGFFQRADALLTAERVTLVTPTVAFHVNPNANAVLPSELGFALYSSAFVGADTGFSIEADPLITYVEHHDNVFDGVTNPYTVAATAGANEQMIAGGWDTATYGDGGYLIRPPALAHSGVAGGPGGAEILYRTVDGVLTTTPLWPWPLEDRIAAEEGVSVTWESGGGLWRASAPVWCP